MIKWQQYLDSACYPANTAEGNVRRKCEIKKAVGNVPDAFKNGRVLMMGCGDGYEVRLLKERGFTDVIGLTYERKEYKNGRDKIGDNIVRGEMHELPFMNSEFDFVYSKETLEHSLAPYIALCELNRVMKNGAGFMHYIAEGEVKQGDWYHFSCFPPYVWADLFHLTGFETEKILTAKDRGDDYIIQSAYHGKKIWTKDLKKQIKEYSLPAIMRNIKRDKLDLLCE